MIEISKEENVVDSGFGVVGVGVGFHVVNAIVVGVVSDSISTEITDGLLKH